ncbi:MULTISPECIES: helix-turn-helix domain-containing protein [Kordiimonas]|jgi:AraC-like DNA-binding protein|uniref:helix-turn-helix domain-containing protein n=1 Tax=Kordiimonas TaxID=288021 RepID=UPI00257F8615|nr:helix-turn-helix transcriptional regulator [Kordiimonas sp. UBA4487]
MMVTLSAASIVALVEAIVAFLLTGLLLSSSHKPARWFAGFSFVFGASFLLQIFFEQVPGARVRGLLLWFSWLWLLAMPCLYQYAGLAMAWKHRAGWMHFVLAPVMALVLGVSIAYGEMALAFSVARWVLVLQVFGYGIHILMATRRYRDALREDHSNLHGIDLAWLERLLVLLMMLVGFDMALFPLLGIFGVPHATVQFYFNFLSSLYLLWLAREAARQHFVAWTSATKPAAEPRGVDDDSIRALAADLDARMKEARWYREPELTLGQLAAHMGMSRHLLSEVLNKGVGRSFYDYVNELRVAAASDILLQSEKSIIDAAFDAGFNNKASFNRAFKAQLGMTPSQYRREKKH